MRMKSKSMGMSKMVGKGMKGMEKGMGKGMKGTDSYHSTGEPMDKKKPMKSKGKLTFGFK